ncbi:APC family permease [Streptomyces sp. SP17KL33]|uniref:APC family permease n=1 Tax=Streptomyces sp. SP17KL33 TaxID=3002534 RepID=UPI002E77190C|nr:APC family permease [Streptomyces sp. SP17KL33]MEE1836474.1 APC family permease [Streptomyces sp. SP17KL33]
MTMQTDPPTLRPGPRMPGLDRRNLGPVQVFAQSVSAAGPTAGMAATPAIAASTAGGGTVWSFAIATAVALLIAGCIGQFTRRMAAAGSLYSLAAKGLGPAGAFACACALLVGYTLLVSAGLAGAAIHLHALFGPVGPATGVATVLLGAIVAGCAVKGIRLSARLILLVEGVSIALILAVYGLLLGGTGFEPPGHVPQSGQPPGGVGGVAAAVLPALAAFIGFESAAALGVEARRPFRSVPRAVTWTAAVVGLMHVCAAAFQVSLPGSARLLPLRDIASGQRLPWMAALVDAGIASSFLACALAGANALARVLFSLGTEGIAPRGLCRTHRSHRTPHVAVAVALPVATALPMTMLACGIPAEHVLELLLQASTVGCLIAYLLVCLAVPFFLRGIGEATPGPMARALTVVPVLVLALGAFVASAPSGPFTLAFATLTGAALAWYVWLRRRRPAQLGGIGVYDETSLADVLDPRIPRATSPSDHR